MQNISNLIDRVHLSKDSMPGEQPKPNKPSAKLMHRLWEVMLGIFGHRFESSFGADPNEMWTEILAGVTPQMMGAGIERMKRDPKYREWPPNALEFRALCEPSNSDYGLPDDDAAYRMAVDWPRLRKQDRHPAVLATLGALDTWSWRRLDDQTARKQFAVAWRKTVDRVRAEGDGWLPAVPDQLEYQPPGKQAPRGDARQALAGILGGL